MSKCIDRNDQTTQSRLALDSGSLPIVNGRGELNVYAIKKFEDDFVDQIKRDGAQNPLTELVNQYGNDEFYGSLTNLNNFLGNSDLSQYPVLADRYSKGPISAIEYADILPAYYYNPTKINTSSGFGDSNLLKNLDSYYRDGGFSGSFLGSFCQLFPQVFQAVGGFFTIIGGIAGLISDALSLLDKVRNLEDPVKAIIERITIITLVNQIKEKLTDVIVETWNDIKRAVQNFDLGAVVGEVETYIDENVFKKAAKIRDDVTEILTDENRDGVVDKAKGLFDYAAGLFENPSLEEIQFLIARFCNFVSNVEALIKDIKTPMDNYAFKYQRIVGRMKRISNIATAAAISSGAIRFDDETRREQINKMRDAWAPPENTGSGPVDIERLKGLPNETLQSMAINTTGVFTEEQRTAAAILQTRGIEVNVPGGQIEQNKFSDRVQQAETPDVNGDTPSTPSPPAQPDVQTPCVGIEEDTREPSKNYTPTGKVPNNPRPITPEEYSGIPTWDDIKDGNHPRFSFNSDMGAKGWTGIDPKTKAKLVRLQKAIGTKFIINSGFRSEQYQNKLRAQYKAAGVRAGKYGNYGVAFNSQHMKGRGIDVSRQSFSSERVFIQEAKKAGFTYIKKYNSFIHLDDR